MDLNIHSMESLPKISVKLFRGACGSKSSVGIYPSGLGLVKLFRGACGSKSVTVADIVLT